MRIWDRLRGKQTPNDTLEETVLRAKRDLQAGSDPRCSEAVGEILSWLWHINAAIITVWKPQSLEWRKMKAAYDVLSEPGLAVEEFAQFVATLDLPAMPEPMEERYVCLAEILSRYIVSHISRSSVPNPHGERMMINNCKTLQYAVYLVGRLQMAEAHKAVCQVIQAIYDTLRSMGRGDRLGNRVGVSPHINLQRAAMQCLLALPPDKIPAFWRGLASLQTTQLFQMIVTQMRDPRAVPEMLAVLPQMDPDGQAYVLVALGNIGDVRAVPALQEIAADSKNLLAPRAAEVLASIMRTSRDDAAQLLRPTDARHAGNAAATLLRAAEGSPDATTRSDELLRPGSAPLERNRENKNRE